ncbi:PadR family transcriptional regulator [Salinibacterium sp. UTAS2018]|uniref:PadR family transcriptional regulator n=1 Tax=Salinibacterium sp. UTAS2018 TaxID=2508880 RepID=UPI0010095A6D|nr:PadR family transcriptional regulator [Salinibacterium sp. UTAS2018]QAV70481.1 PadR family transcriptional regulator [Salinibacterium sp. UTAS2018]
MKVDVGSQLRKGVAEACILGILAQQPMYGWQLSEKLIAHNLIASIGTLYPMLTRMRAQGVVSTYDEASDAGPVRKYYELTPLGVEVLNTFRSQWAPFAQTVHDIIGEDPHHA